MANYVTCNNSNVTIQPYEPRLFEWNTPEGKAFFSSTINKLLQAIGDNIVLDGLSCMAILNGDTLSVTVVPGYAIHSSTLINITSTYTVELTNISGYDPNGFFVVYLDFQIIRNTYEQKPAIGIAYISDNGDASIAWNHSRYGLLLDIFQIKDGNVIVSDENFINIETKPYYRYGYDSSNMHLTKYISHFLKEIIINDEATVRFSGDVTVDNDLHVKGDIVSDNDIIVKQDVEIAGDFEVQGGNTFLNTDVTLIKDPLLKINVGEKSPDGISSNQLRISGLQIDRGYLQDAMLFFDETDDTWKIGFENEKPADLLTSSDIEVKGLYPVIVKRKDYKSIFEVSLNQEYMESLRNKISVFYNDQELTNALAVLNFKSKNHPDVVTNENGKINIDFDKLEDIYYIYESKNKESYVRINHNLNTKYIFVEVYSYDFKRKYYLRTTNRVVIEDENNITVKVEKPTLLRVIISKVSSFEILDSSETLYDDWVVTFTKLKYSHIVKNNLCSYNVLQTIWKINETDDGNIYTNILALDHTHLNSYEVMLFDSRKLMIINEAFTDDNPNVFNEFYIMSPLENVIINHELNTEDIDVFIYSHGKTIYAPIYIIDKNNIKINLTEEVRDFHITIVKRDETSNREFLFLSENQDEEFEITHNLGWESVRVCVWNMDGENPELIIPYITILDKNKVKIKLTTSHKIKVLIRAYPYEEDESGE